MDDSQITAYKSLACAVMQLAIAESRWRYSRQEAIRFLTHPIHRPEREVWLAWLGMDDTGFQTLLRQRVFQGQSNRVTLLETPR